MIRLATAADLAAIYSIYDAILDHEATTTVYTNWSKGVYPTAEVAQQALAEGTLLVGEADGELWGSVNLNDLQPPEYSSIPWTIPAEDKHVRVIHTLCIHPDASGRGYARQLIAFCEDKARRQGASVMRLDTWEHNAPTNHLYPSLGFSFAGSEMFLTSVDFYERLNCYEKHLL